MNNQRTEILREYKAITESQGKPPTRNDYVRLSKFGWKYETEFGTYTNLRREALSTDCVDENITEYDISELNPRIRKHRKSLAEAYKYYSLTPVKKHNKIVVLSDIHAPFHHKEILKKIIKVIQDIKPTHLVLSGDFIDMYTISSFNAGSLKDLEGITLGDEYDLTNELLDSLDNVLPDNCEKVAIQGNHEHRFNRWLSYGDNKKYSGAIKPPVEALRLKERGYNILDDYKQDFILVGEGLEIIHGDYTNKYFTRKHLEHLLRDVLIGHLHTLQVFTGANGLKAYSLGFLGDVSYPVFNYASRLSKMRWQHGFCIVYWDAENDITFKNLIEIENANFIVEGKNY